MASPAPTATLCQLARQGWPLLVAVLLTLLLGWSALHEGRGGDPAAHGWQAHAEDLLQAMPLDLRVVLSWDADNSDMDLWVTDPNGERAYYGNRLTYQGGQMSQDFTGGYGPDQFSLRNAKPGRYKVEANYFGSRQQLVTGATTLMLRLTTHWGTAKQKDQMVTMRLKDRAETVLVGEFEVR